MMSNENDLTFTNQSEAFWRKTLAGVQAPTPLIKGRVDQSVEDQTTCIDKTRHLTKTLTESLQSTAQLDHISLKTLVLGAWALLLSRYSGEETVIFGATMAVRDWTDTDIEPESRIGLLINTLPICTRVVPDLDLSTWLQNLHHQWVATKDHADLLSLTEIQKCSEIPANLPLFETLVVFENNDVNIVPVSGYDWTECKFELPPQKHYPLSLYVTADTCLHLTFKYEPQRFDAATINRMIGHFQTLLEGIVANPQQRISALPWLTQAERHQSLVDERINHQAKKQVEIALLEEPSVEDCRVLARETENDGIKLVAYVSGQFHPEQLQSRLQKNLGTTDIPPCVIVPLATLPLTATGQVDEQKLAHLEVIDSELIQQWEEKLQSLPAVEQVAVVAQECSEPLPPLHLSDLLPDWKITHTLATAATAVSVTPTESKVEALVESKKPALSYGGELRSDADAPTTLMQTLRRTAQQIPDHGIIYLQTDGSEQVQSYPALLEEASIMLAGLRKRHLKPQDKVIFQLDNPRDFIPAFWGCLLGGFVPVPLSVPPTYEPSNSAVKRLYHAWQSLKQPLVLTSKPLAFQMRSLSKLLNIKNFFIETVEILRDCQPDHRWHVSQPDDLAVLLLTSGSTGIPKGVMLSHSNLLSNVVSSAQINHFGRNEISLNWLHLDHVGSLVRCCLRDVYVGNQQIHAPTEMFLKNPLNWLNWIENYRVTFAWAPNFALGLINKHAQAIKQQQWDISCLKSVLSVAEPIVPQTAKTFYELLAPHGLSINAMHSAWGMSETGAAVVFSHRYLLNLPSDDYPFVEVGQPVSNLSIRIVDDQGEITQEDTVGQVQIKGPMISCGYYQNPELNQASFTPNAWLKTGDLGFLHNGCLTITGRQKDIIIINGFNYYSHEIELLVDEVADVEASYTAACAIRTPNSNTDELLIFFHTPKAEDEALAQLLKEIRGSVVSNLGVSPTYLIPLDKADIPKSSVGKILRHQLKARFEAGEFDPLLKRVDVLLGNDNTLPDWFYRQTWRPKAVGRIASERMIGTCLVFLDSSGLGERLCAKLSQEQSCIGVEIGSELTKLNDNRYRINPNNLADYRQLLTSISTNHTPIQEILHLWTYEQYEGEISSLEKLEQAQAKSIYSLLFLVQALTEIQGSDTPVRLLMVASHSQSVLGDSVAYERTPVLGLIKTIPQELPWLDSRHLDLLMEDNEINAQYVLQELKVIQKESEMAYRNGQRWVPRLAKVDWQQENRAPIPFKRGGMYLLSGGLGEIGVEIAKYLLQHYEARLLLVGRTHLPARQSWEAHLAPENRLSQRLKAYLELEQLGGEVIYEAVDICDLALLKSVVAKYQFLWQRELDGIIHLARITQEHLLTEETRESLATMLQPKVSGTWVLHQLIKDKPEAVFVHFSSVSSLFGTYGMGAYAAANRFLDNFSAYQRQKNHLRHYCFAWSIWEEIGLERSYQMREVSRAHGYYTIPTRTGLNSWFAGLQLTPGYLMVGLDSNNPYMRRHVETNSLRLQKLIAYFTVSDNTATDELLPSLIVHDRFQNRSLCDFIPIEEMPLTNSGAVDRKKLVGKYPKLETTYIMPQTEAEQRIAVVWQQVLQLEKVGIYDSFFELGGNSLLMLQVQGELQTLFKPSLSVVELFQYPTIYALAKHLTQDDIQKTSSVFKTSKVSSSKDKVSNNKDIAIIGMSCRVPGAGNVETFWKNLCDGIESITFFTDEELRLKGVEPTLLNDPNYVKASPVLEGIELFDAPFFGYSPREAEIMDPQHRQFLECAWEAIENAGYDVDRVEGEIGVYAGTNKGTYLLDNLYSNRELRESGSFLQLMIANEKDYLATRISYKFDLKGPSITIQTACSTSLVAVHIACQNLLAGDCDIALAGGVSINARQDEGYLYDNTIYSPDGHCRAFDARAQGTINSNGLGIVVLKRLDQALTDGDCIHAVIKASAINNDGALKVGYTAPSVDGQTALIAKAMQDIDPETISYIEAHGTGTALGDPIEITALTQAFRCYTQKKGFCAIGSLKTNVGHLIQAAGVAGLIKTVLALKHKKLPPSLHFEQPNPKIDFANSPFFVNASLSEWKSNGAPRRAGVSSYGIGGTNAHVIVEEAPLSVINDSQPSKPKRPWQLLVLSAKTASALETATANLAEHLKQHPNINFADVAYTLSQGRKIFAHRRILVCQTVDEATEALSTLAAPILTQMETHKIQPVMFMFSGQGSQYVNMALELYQHELIFREQVDKCAEILKPHLNLDLRNVLYPNAEQIAEAEKQLEQTAITQPALFVIEYALAQLWIAWGLQPVAMIGHSIGEYVAACLAQVFSLEDALALVAVRGQLMQSCPSGAMLSVPLPEAEVKQLMNQVNQELSLAAHNAPSLCAVSGTTDAVTDLENRLTAQGVECLRLHTSHAFHSAMMEPILAPFTAQIKKMRLQPPQMSYLSNVSGTWITAAEATNPDYWARHLRHTVRFAEGLQELLKNPKSVLLEIGPGRTLATLAGRHPEKTAEHKIFHSVRHPKDQQADLSFLLTTLGKLWLAGVPLNWASFYAQKHCHRLPLPTYPFERQRYWIEAPKSVPQTSLDKKPAIFLDKKPDMSDWFYLPVWKQSTPLLTKPEKLAASCWLVFLDPCDLGTQLSKKLEQIDQEVITVKVGTELTQLNDREYTLNPHKSEDYEALLKELRTLNKIPQTIVHLWTVTHNGDEEPKYERVDEAQTLGFYSLLFLTQAIEKQELTNDIQLMLVSNNVQKVTGEETLYPEKSTVLGPVKVIGQEYPNIHSRSIDVLIPPEKIEFEQLIDLLWAELTNQTTDKMVAYRAGHRWVQNYEPVRIEDSLNRKSRLKEGGTYLITGGLGGIGLVLAEHLAKTVHANLILTGRSQLPSRSDWDEWLTTHDEHDNVSRKIRKVQALEKQGGKVMTTRADVANQQQMQEVIEQAKEQFGLINGVIHAAGVPDGALIPRQTPKTAETIFSPKIKGTLVLDHLLSEFELDFLVLCSSIASVFGTGGQVSYTAANSFLDAFAHFKSTKGNKSTIAINWDAWQEEGMAVDALDHYGRVDRTVAQVSVSKPQQTKAVFHPLFDNCIIESADQERYISHLSVSRFWFLDEHRIKGKSVLPGTAYLELARAAFEPHAKLDTIEIREIYFLYPLIVPENEEKEVHTVLTKQGDHFEFVISSRSGPETWQEHAKGFVAATAAQPTKYNIEAIERDCQQPKIIPNGCLPQLESSMVQFGPHWYSLQWMKLGHRQGLAFLELANDLVADLNVYQLHPALLDMAVIFLKLHEPSPVLSLPFYYKKVTIKAPLPAKFYSYVRYVDRPTAQTEMLQFNVTLIDEQGMELVNIEKFTSREVTDDIVTPQQNQAPSEEKSRFEQDSNFYLEIATPGILDSLTFRPDKRRQPRPDEVEIEVCATGLNFKEVLYAIGLLPIPHDVPFKFGLECAGRIVTVGKNIKDFQVGDEVIAFAPASFSAFTTTPVASVAPKPNNLSFEEAATIPVTFLTVYYALVSMGRLSQGERVLIHAAAGGVGMAAIEVARWVGAEIFATAGSPEKRAFLRSLGIQHVMDSRSLAFADKVMEYTNGKGVDVVLNSLGGEFISKSIATLAPFGRFLELGLRDILNNTQLGLRPFENGLSYIAIKLDHNDPRFSVLFREIVQHFNKGHFSPLPAKVFPITEVTTAFDYMAQTKHIGKIVVSLRDKEKVNQEMADKPNWNEVEPSGNKIAQFPKKSEQRGQKLPSPKTAGKGVTVKNILQKNLKHGLLSAEGVDVFTRIMADPFPQVIVSTRDLYSRFEQSTISNVLSFAAKAESAAPSVKSTAHPRPQLGSAYLAPHSEMEKTLADIWQKLLGIEQIGIHDDFFELGGDSLLATRIISQVRETCKIGLDINILFDKPTVAAIAESIEKMDVQNSMASHDTKGKRIEGEI
jgi:acyl transferase domain-containing protein/acyl-CoA synthetase (AMP-forming)/AMP-acid ligase II/acyl carrier protein